MHGFRCNPDVTMLGVVVLFGVLIPKPTANMRIVIDRIRRGSMSVRANLVRPRRCVGARPLQRLLRHRGRRLGHPRRAAATAGASVFVANSRKVVGVVPRGTRGSAPVVSWPMMVNMSAVGLAAP